jgi:hypothetical protein
VNEKYKKCIKERKKRSRTDGQVPNERTVDIEKRQKSKQRETGLSVDIVESASKEEKKKREWKKRNHCAQKRQ